MTAGGLERAVRRTAAVGRRLCVELSQGDCGSLARSMLATREEVVSGRRRAMNDGERYSRGCLPRVSG